jgi:hypothetical protein
MRCAISKRRRSNSSFAPRQTILSMIKVYKEVYQLYNSKYVYYQRNLDYLKLIKAIHPTNSQLLARHKTGYKFVVG